MMDLFLNELLEQLCDKKGELGQAERGASPTAVGSS